MNARTERSREVLFYTQYLVLLLCGLGWAHIERIHERIGDRVGLLHALLAVAFVYVLVRAFLVIGNRVSKSCDHWWLAVDLFIVTAGVRLTGGIHSEAGLVYFWPIATSSISRSPRKTLAVGAAIGVLYVAATWPGDVTSEYFVRLGTCLLVLVMATILAAHYALTEAAGVEELARLREQVALADYRGRLSQEMHDGIQYYLVQIAARLDIAKSLLARDPAKAAQMAVDQRVTVQQASDELRSLVRRLRAPEIEQHGLVDGLREQAARLSERSQTVASVEVEGEARPLGRDIEHAVFRIVQEALTNIEKHAQASEVRVCLQYGADALQCTVSYNGVGFGEVDAAPDHGLGLPGMRERAAALGGTVGIESKPGEGTRVTVSVPTPLEPQPQAA